MFIRIITVVFCVVILSSPTFSEGAWDFLNGKKSKEKEQAEPEDIKQSKNEPITGYTIKIPSCDNLEDFPLNYIDALIADGTISAEIEKYFSQKLSNWNEADYEMFQKIFNDCNTKVYKFFDDYIDETFHEDVADASRKLMAGRTVRKVKKTKNKVESEDSRRAGLSQPAKKRDKSKTVKANKSSVRKGKVKAIKKSSAEQNKKSISSKSGHEETIQRIDISNSRLGSFLSGGKKKNCEAAFKWLGQVEKEYQNIDNELPSGSSLRKVFPKFRNLYSDPYFVPVFGKPFDELTWNERKKYEVDVFTPCFKANKDKGEYTRWAILPISVKIGVPFLVHDDTSKFVKQSRTDRKLYQNAIEEYESFSGKSEEYNAAIIRDRKTKPVLARMWPSERNQYDRAFASAISRTVDAELAYRLKNALARVKDPELIDFLKAGWVKYNKPLLDKVSPDVRDSVIAQLKKSVEDYYEQASEAEKEKFTEFGSGLAGLKAGVKWYAEYSEKNNINSDNENVQQTLFDLAAYRSDIFSSSKKAIEREIDKPAIGKEIAYFVRLHLSVPSDKEHPVGNALIARAKNRYMSIAANNDKIISKRITAFNKWIRQKSSGKPKRKSGLASVIAKGNVVYEVKNRPNVSLSPDGPSVASTMGSHSRNILNSLNVARANSRQFATNFKNARKLYQNCQGMCEDQSKVEDYFSYQLYLKDMQYMMVELLDNNNKRMGGSDAPINLIRNTMGVIDEDHSNRCYSTFSDWIRCMDKPGGGRLGELTTFLVPQRLIECKEDYSVHEKCRNSSEFYRQPHIKKILLSKNAPPLGAPLYEEEILLIDDKTGMMPTVYGEKAQAQYKTLRESSQKVIICKYSTSTIKRSSKTGERYVDSPLGGSVEYKTWYKVRPFTQKQLWNARAEYYGNALMTFSHPALDSCPKGMMNIDAIFGRL